MAQSDDNLWSDFPLPSSPPFFAQREKLEAGIEVESYDWGALDLGLVDVWEDGTATEGLGNNWDGSLDSESEKGKESANAAAQVAAADVAS